jgi:purine nucleosidase
LTNVALAVRRDPALAERVSRVVIMGAAADHVGNVNPVAEFNRWVDPHAVQVVLDSGLPLEFVGWDISRRDAVIVPDEAQRLRAIGTPLAEFCIDIQAVVAAFCEHDTKLAGFDMPDPIAMAYAIDPDVATETQRLHLEVECESTVTRGMVVMDLLGFTRREPNALVVMHADHGRFIDHLEATLRG